MTGAVPCHEPEANEARSQPTPHRSNQSDNAAPCGYAALGWSASTWRLQIGLNNLPGITSTPPTQPLSKRPLRMFWWLIFSLVMSFLLFLQIHVYTAVEWGVLVVGIFVFPITFALIRGFILEEFREDIAHSMALAWSRGLCAVVMVLLYVLVTATLGEWPEFESNQAAISEYKNQADDWSGS